MFGPAEPWPETSRAKNRIAFLCNSYVVLKAMSLFSVKIFKIL